jgi:two-component system, LytTR family, sensor kinase
MTLRRDWLVACAIATMLGVAFGVQRVVLRFAKDQPLEMIRTVGAQLAPWYVWLLLFPLLWWLAGNRRAGDARRSPPLLGLALLGGGVACIHTALSVIPLGYITDWTLVNRPWYVGFQQLLLNRGVTAWVEYALIMAMVLAVSYHRRALTSAQVTQALEQQVVDSELRALRMQLEPHFLFNTLNAIGAYVRSAPDVAESMLRHLSHVLRAVVEGRRDADATLRHELDLVRSYLAIHQVRMGDRLQVRVDVPEPLLTLHLPTLLLQPLVENAIVHGAARRPGAVEVVVTAEQVADRLRVSVVDRGAPARGAVVTSTGVGLANTRARLQHAYGAEQSIDIAVSDAETQVTVVIPARGAAA